MKSARWKVVQGDCLRVMRSMADASFDACVCDPPYEIGFMNLAFDRTGIAYRVDLWREVLRVLKPGAHLLAFGGSRTYHRMACAIEDAGFQIRDSLHWLQSQGFPKSHQSLKPSHEPIVLARKPLEGTVAANVQAHGVGGLNIDGCRVEDGTDRTSGGNPSRVDFSRGWAMANTARASGGRWPPNVLLTCCGQSPHTEDCAVAELDRQSGVLRNGGQNATSNRASKGYHRFGGDSDPTRYAGDSGGASRFFPVFRYCGKASKKDRGEGNTHPTVKPTALMRWLCRLITPPGGLILDPFAGSGTTVKAAKLEGFGCVGIEIERESCVIARKRVSA